MVMFSRFARYFEEVARRGSIRAASEHVHTASSAINRQILRAEEDLKVELFERQSGGMRLTAAGEVLIYHMRRWQREFDQVCGEIEGMQGLHGGRISLSVAEGIAGEFLAGILADFSRQFPRIQLSVKVPPESALDLLTSGDADICLTYRSISHKSHKIQYQQPMPIGVIVSSSHPLAQRTTVCLKDCIEFPVAMLDRNIMTQDRVSSALDILGLELRHSVMVDNFFMLRLLVEKGVGIGFLTRMDSVAEIHQGRLVFLDIEDGQIQPLTTALVTTAHPTMTVSNFCQFVAERLRAVQWSPFSSDPSSHPGFMESSRT